MVGLLSPGVVFAADYRVTGLLAQGGMGAVYAAEQISTGKARAIKLMHPQLVANTELRRRFEQEARVGSRIESDHVVEVQAAGVDAGSGVPYLVMELLEGEDLAAHVRRRGPLGVAEVRAIFEQLGHAVAAAHAAGVVHRDLKPENVFLARSRRAGAPVLVKVLDFGIAKLQADASSQGTTAAMGSPQWMAPEQTERGPIGPQADVWSLGLLAYFLLTGRPYWRSAQEAGATVTQLLREILFEPLEAPSARAAQTGAPPLPPAFDAWFVRAVARDPSQRFADARAAWSELGPVLGAPRELATAATLPALPPLPSPPTPSFGPAPNLVAATPSPVALTPAPPTGRRYMAWALGGGMVTLTGGLALLAVFVFFRPRSDAGVVAPTAEDKQATVPAPTATAQSAEAVASAPRSIPTQPTAPGGQPATVAMAPNATTAPTPKPTVGGGSMTGGSGAPKVGGGGGGPATTPPALTDRTMATSYSHAEIDAVKQAAQPRFDRCYAPGATTTAAVTLDVSPDGTPKMVGGTVAAHPMTRACLEREVSALRFPKFTGPNRRVSLTIAMHPMANAIAE